MRGKCGSKKIRARGFEFGACLACCGWIMKVLNAMGMCQKFIHREIWEAIREFLAVKYLSCLNF